jgi:hypothetical protein
VRIVGCSGWFVTASARQDIVATFQDYIDDDLDGRLDETYMTKLVDGLLQVCALAMGRRARGDLAGCLCVCRSLCPFCAKRTVHRYVAALLCDKRPLRDGAGAWRCLSRCDLSALTQRTIKAT